MNQPPPPEPAIEAKPAGKEYDTLKGLRHRGKEKKADIKTDKSKPPELAPVVEHGSNPHIGKPWGRARANMPEPRCCAGTVLIGRSTMYTCTREITLLIVFILYCSVRIYLI